MLGRAVAQSCEIVERVRDEFFAARILCLRCGCEELNEVLRLGCGFQPSLSRISQKKFLQLFLLMSQGCLIGLKILKSLTAKFSVAF